MRSSRKALVLLAVSFLGGEALAHGGSYQPPKGEAPPDPPPPPPPPPTPPDGTGPQTPGGDPGGPTSGGKGGGDPQTGGGTGGGPTSGGGDGPQSGGGDGGSPSTPGGDGGGPKTGGGGGHGGGTGGGGPQTGGGDGGGPTTGGGPQGGGGSKGGKGKSGAAGSLVPEDHWTRWWYANRLFLLDLHGRVRDRQPTTPSGPAAARVNGPSLWRAKAQEALVFALSDPDEDVASAAAVALGKAGDPADAPAVLAVLVDASRRQPVREAAALGLGLLGPETSSDDVRRKLETIAADPRAHERLRGFCVYALGLRGETASLPFLVDAAHGEGELSAVGASALGLSHCAVTREDLERMLDAPRGDRSRATLRRVYAAHGLARLGDVASVPVLRETVADEDAEVRRAAILALGALALPDDTATVDVLVRVLHRDRDRGCRNMAAVALGRCGAERARRELRWSYDNSDTLERPFAALGLALHARRTHDAETSKLLRRGLEESANADIRGALCIACGLTGDLDAAPAVRRIASERGDPELRAQAALAIGMLGDVDAGGAVLREILHDGGSPSMQREAALALGMLGDAEAVRILLELVTREGSVFVQGSAAVALGRIGGEESAATLVAMMKDRDRPGISRGMAAVALGLLLDRNEGRILASIGADLDWYALTPTVREILDIL